MGMMHRSRRRRLGRPTGGSPPGSIDNPFNATNPDTLPVGNEWVQFFAYSFVDLGPADGGVRLGIWVELSGAEEPVMFRQIGSSLNISNGIRGLAILDTIIPQTISFTDASGHAVFFNMRFPAGMVAGDILPPSAIIPPINSGPPGLSIEVGGDSLLYTAGVWIGGALTIDARLIVNNVDVGPATPAMAVLPAWRGQPAFVRESATNSAGGPVLANSGTLTVPAELAPDDKMAAILAGRTGYAFDAHDLAVLFQDNLGTVPVAAVGQPVGLWRSKWGAQLITGAQAVATQRPLWNGEALAFDGVDDLLALGGSGNWLGSSRVTAVFRFKMKRLVGNQAIYTLWFNSNGASGFINWYITATGQINASVREASGGTAMQSVLSAAGLVNLDVEHTLTIEINWATGVVLAWLDGVQVINFTLAGATGNITWNVNNTRLARTAANGFTAQIEIGRWVLLHEAVSATIRGIFEDWVEEAPPPPPPAMALDWQQPTDASTLPPVGELREHNGQVWKNISAAGNLWEPGIFGWEAVA